MTQFIGDSGKVWIVDLNDRIGDPSGNGQVFRGISDAGEGVAVKRVLLFNNSSADRQLRQREVDILRTLEGSSSDHVMSTLDIGYDGDTLYIVMPEADKSLSRAIQDGMLSDDEKTQALQDVGEGLRELEIVRVLHRDLKPSNVLLHEGTWKLADFGISRNLDESTGTFTFTGFGTLLYMAPEIWRGQRATSLSDLYSYGVLAFEVLSGLPPFVSSDESELGRLHMTEVAPALVAPEPFPRLVARLLRKDPASRPQSASDIIRVLSPGPPVPSGALSRLSEALNRKGERESIEIAKMAKIKTAQEDAESVRKRGELELREIFGRSVERATAVDEDARLYDDDYQVGLRIGGANLIATLLPVAPNVKFQGHPIAWLGQLMFSMDDAPPIVGSPGRPSEPEANIAYAEVNGHWDWTLIQVGRSFLFRGEGNLTAPKLKGMYAREFLDALEELNRGGVQSQYSTRSSPLNEDQLINLIAEGIADASEQD